MWNKVISDNTWGHALLFFTLPPFYHVLTVVVIDKFLKSIISGFRFITFHLPLLSLINMVHAQSCDSRSTAAQRLVYCPCFPDLHQQWWG